MPYNIAKRVFKPLKGLENKEFSKWNPQAEFTYAEEKGGFQGILPMEPSFYSSV